MSSSMPMYTSPLIGRDEESAEVARVLQDPGKQLITLVGASGTGKTRLSIQVCSTMQEAFPDGIFFVSLAPVRDPLLVLPLIADRLQVRETGVQPLLKLLIERCVDKQLLLILDNMEQLLGAKHDLEALIAHVPKLKVLITSQQPLELEREHVYHIPPLSYPQTDGLAPSKDLQHYTAIALFVDRMRVVQPDFALDRSNTADVIAICQLLQGLPLAIELVAAHSDILTPDILLLLLRTHLSIHRQKSHIRERIIIPILSWCYGRLGPEEQWLFPRLSMMRGGFTLDAVQAIMEDLIPQAFELAPTQVMQHIQQSVTILKAKNLLLEEQLNQEQTRYQMLDVVHEYGESVFNKTNKQEAFLDKYSHYYIELAQQGYEGLKGSEQAVWMKKLTLDQHNLRMTYDYLIEKRLDDAVHMNIALSRFWYFQGSLSEALRTAQDLMTRVETPYSEPHRMARLFGQAGITAYSLQQLTLAHTYYQTALDLFTQTGDEQGQANILNNLGLLALAQNNFEEAQTVLQQSLRLWEELDEPWQIANTLNTLGIVALNQQDFDIAQDYYSQSLTYWDRVGYSIGKAMALNNLGDIALKQAEYVTSHELFQQAFELYAQHGGDRFLGNVCVGLAHTAFGQQHYAMAYTHAREAIQRGIATQNIGAVIDGLESVARIAATTQQWPLAALTLSAALSYRATNELPRSPHDEAWLQATKAQVEAHQAIEITTAWTLESINNLLEQELPTLLPDQIEAI